MGLPPLPCGSAGVNSVSESPLPVASWDLLELLFLVFPSVDIDSGYYTVKFDSLLLKEAVVEGDSVIPPLRSEEGASSAESDEDSVDDSGYAKGGESGDGVSASDLWSRSAFLCVSCL